MASNLPTTSAKNIAGETENISAVQQNEGPSEVTVEVTPEATPEVTVEVTPGAMPGAVSDTQVEAANSEAQTGSLTEKRASDEDKSQLGNSAAVTAEETDKPPTTGDAVPAQCAKMGSANAIGDISVKRKNSATVIGVVAPQAVNREVAATPRSAASVYHGQNARPSLNAAANQHQTRMYRPPLAVSAPAPGVAGVRRVLVGGMPTPQINHSLGSLNANRNPLQPMPYGWPNAINNGMHVVSLGSAWPPMLRNRLVQAYPNSSISPASCQPFSPALNNILMACCNLHSVLNNIAARPDQPQAPSGGDPHMARFMGPPMMVPQLGGYQQNMGHAFQPHQPHPMDAYRNGQPQGMGPDQNLPGPRYISSPPFGGHTQYYLSGTQYMSGQQHAGQNEYGMEYMSNEEYEDDYYMPDPPYMPNQRYGNYMGEYMPGPHYMVDDYKPGPQYMPGPQYNNNSAQRYQMQYQPPPRFPNQAAYPHNPPTYFHGGNGGMALRDITNQAGINRRNRSQSATGVSEAYNEMIQMKQEIERRERSRQAAAAPRGNPAVLHGNPAVVHVNTAALHGNTAALHGNPAVVHVNTAALHGNPAVVHVNTAALHGNPAVVHVNTAALHGNPAVVHVNTAALHGNTAVLHGNPAVVHVNTTQNPLNATGRTGNVTVRRSAALPAEGANEAVHMEVENNGVEFRQMRADLGPDGQGTNEVTVVEQLASGEIIYDVPWTGGEEVVSTMSPDSENEDSAIEEREKCQEEAEVPCDDMAAEDTAHVAPGEDK